MYRNSPFKQSIRIRRYTQSVSNEKETSKQRPQQKRTELRSLSINQEKKVFSSALEVLMYTKNHKIQPSKKNFPTNLGQMNKKSRVLTLGKENSKKSPNNINNKIKNPMSSFVLSNNNESNLPNVSLNQKENQLSQVIDQNLNEGQVCIRVNNSHQRSYAYSDGQQGITRNQADVDQNEAFTEKQEVHFTRSVWFSYEKAYSINYRPDPIKVTIATQTLDTSIDDKYYLAYMKHRALKDKTFEDILYKESKLQSLIKQTQEFHKNNQKLFQYVNEGPSNDRQKRVYALAIDLQNQEKQIKEIFKRITTSDNQHEKELAKRIGVNSSKSRSLISSIENLTKTCTVQLLKQTSQCKGVQSESENLINDQIKGTCEKVTKILGRVSNQFKNLKRMFFYLEKFGESVMQKYRQEVLMLQIQHKEWENLQYQNRVLLLNFVERIKKFPAMTFSLFGENDEKPAESAKISDTQRYDAYMKIKCEACFQMKSRMELLKENNQRIKPMFKVLEWLIRDGSKTRQSLELI